MNYNVNKNQMRQGNISVQGTVPQNMARFGAHELLMTHEILSNDINCINHLEMLRPHVNDPELAQILDNQLNFKIQGYNNLVNFLHNSGGTQAVPYRSPKHGNVQYGLRNPSPDKPNTDPNQLNDQDISAAILGCAKTSAVWDTQATIECADPTLHEMMSNCVQSSINMVYETFQYMNRKGYYQVPTLQENTTQTIIDSYQPAQMAQMNFL